MKAHRLLTISCDPGGMGNGKTSGQTWCNGHYSAVHARLVAFLDSGIRQLPPGTEAVVGRAQSHFRRIGDSGAVARLEAINVVLFRIQRAVWSGDDQDFLRQAQRLDEATRTWLSDSPMFPPCEAQGAELAA